VPEAGGPSALPAPTSDSSKPSRDGVAQRSGRTSVGRAEAAPLYRLRAYVWPAIALRLRVALEPLGRLDDFVDGAPVPDVLELLSPATFSGVIGVNRSSGSPAQPNQSPRSLSEIGLPEEELGLLATLLIVLLGAVCLVALARLVVGEDLFEARYWRGHRG